MDPFAATRLYAAGGADPDTVHVWDLEREKLAGTSTKRAVRSGVGRN